MKINISLEENQKIFFISDFHIGHFNILRFDSRPFENLEEMHKTIKDNWNNVVSKDDIIFYLGDLYFSLNEQYIKKYVHELNGKIHFIMGNHDEYENINKMNRFYTINDIVDLNIYDKNGDLIHHFVLCHYPILSWNHKHCGSIHLHGHCHGNLHHQEGDTSEYYKGRVMDVGCNLINYTPISHIEIIEKFK